MESCIRKPPTIGLEKMASKSSQQGSKRNSQQGLQTSHLNNAFKKLTTKLNSDLRRNGDIKGVTDLINPVKEGLRTHRFNSTMVDKSLIIELITLWDSEHGYEICSRLDASLYSIIIQAILQADWCREGERGLHLLAGALYYDARSDLKQRGLLKKKDSIGKECMTLLLEFFTDQNKHDGMRRWAGLTYLQLLQDSDENMTKVEMCPESLRRSIGERSFDDGNEIVRLISGQIIRMLLDTGMSREFLWPRAMDKKVYEGFPASTQDNRGWDQRFQNFIDGVYEKLELPQTESQMYFAQDVILKPQLNFGTRGHNMAFLLEAGHITIWAAATPDTDRFDQGVEIPLDYLTRLTIRSKDGSQNPNELANVHLELDTERGHFCYLDCVDTVIHQVTMIMRLGDVSYMADDISQFCPKLYVDNEFGEGRMGSYILSQNSLSISQSQVPLLLGKKGHGKESEGSSVDPSVSDIAEYPVYHTADHQKDTKAASKLANGKSLSEIDADDEVYQAPKSAVVVLSSSNSKKRIAGVKSKAKPPLVLGQKATVPQVRRSPKSPLEDIIRQLRVSFPSVEDPQLRASLLAINGDVNAAAKLLTQRLQNETETGLIEVKRRPAKPTVANKVRKNKLTAMSTTSKTKDPSDTVDWDPSGSSDAMDAPTPRLPGGKKTANSAAMSQKSRARYSLQPTTPLSIPTPVAAKAQKKTKPKADGDESDRPFGEDEEPRPKKITKKTAKSVVLKKSTSAPSLMQKSVAGTRSKIKSAVTASQIIQGVHANDDVEEVTLNVDKMKPRASQPKRSVISVPNEAMKSQDDFGSKLGNLIGSIYEHSAADTVQDRSTNSNPKLNQPSLPRQVSSPETNVAPDIFLSQERQSSPLSESLVSPVRKMPPPVLPAVAINNVKKAEPKITTTSSTSQVITKAIVEVEGGPDHLTQQVPVIQRSSAVVEADDNMIQAPADIPTLFGSTLKTKVSSDIARKRKADPNIETPSKKRQSLEVLKESEELTALRRSPRIQEQREHQQEVEIQESAKVKEASNQKKIQRAAPTRANLTLSSRSKDAPLGDKVLVDDHMARKQAMISFGDKGALNQGPMSATKINGKNTRSGKDAESAKINEASAGKSIAQVLEHKRKRESPKSNVGSPVIDLEAPAKKRQSLSPPEELAIVISEDELQGGSSPFNGMADNVSLAEENEEVADNPPAALPIRVVTHRTSISTISKVAATRRVSKSNSQPSRVDENGSPMAPSSGPQIDHFGKAKQKLREDPVDRVQNLFGVKDITSLGVFGTKIVLGSIPKARPSSPTEVASRYVPHKKTQGGQYEDVVTNEVVELEKKLADPFVDRMSRTSSGFTDRLLAGNLKSKPNLAPVAVKVTKTSNGNVSLVNVPARTALKANGNNRILWGPAFAATEDVEKTLVNSENESPSEMTSENTTRSFEDELPSHTEEPKDVWNSTLRPHYTKLSDAVHRIADEVIIRLASEEDVLGLLATQYEESGDKMIAGITKNRNLQKDHKKRQLESKRKELVEIYDEAKNFVDKARTNIEKSNMAAFETQWRLEQDKVQEQIDLAQRQVDE